FFCEQPESLIFRWFQNILFCYALDGVLLLYIVFITVLYLRERVSAPHTHADTHAVVHTWSTFSKIKAAAVHL
uniref:Uncharacterized protein n=1 Tax=Scleropages formosus TaxID=113540 RepID=A0A8C9SNV4_SCLFO